MAERKRRTPKVEVEKTTKAVKTTGKVFKNEIIYSEPSKDSPFVGAVLAGELVKIEDSSASSKGWTKITTNVTNITGYINSGSII